eukprot:scaffold14861_cov124-Isochrysis_galbana.AAC.1
MAYSTITRMDEHSSKWRYLVGLANCPRGRGGSLSLKFIFRVSFVEKAYKNEMMIIIILNGNVARKNGGAGPWHVGRLCLATAPLAASWAENVDHSRGSLEREKSCLFRRVGGVQRKQAAPDKRQETRAESGEARDERRVATNRSMRLQIMIEARPYC